MVEIRSLRTLDPGFRIALPQRPVRPKRVTKRRFAVIVRRIKDFPPPTPQPTHCVLWQGTCDKDGYGVRQIKDSKGTWRVVPMHRWIVEQCLGRKLRSSEVILHACDNPPCYRIDHLSVGTIRSNNADMWLKGRGSLPPRNIFHGEAHPMSKLTIEKVRMIRMRVDHGESRKAVAERYGIAVGTVTKIVNGDRWADLDPDP
jgi:hypothetical protein